MNDEKHEVIEYAPVNRQVALAPEWTIDDLVAQTQKVHAAMKAVMTNGEHYGVIPGTKKPTLLKPGAEKLMLLFRLAPKYDIIRGDLDNGHREYQVVCTLTHITTGAFVGEGVGNCSTMETKYRYRGGAHLCPKCGKDSIIKGKAEFGGGWLCFAKKGGCGAKFPDNAFSGQPEKVENPDLAETWNTILKMAKKRSLVDAVLTATAAGDIFTQDLEPTDPGVDPANTKPPDEPPPKATPPKKKSVTERMKDAKLYIQKQVTAHNEEGVRNAFALLDAEPFTDKHRADAVTALVDYIMARVVMRDTEMPGLATALSQGNSLSPAILMADHVARVHDRMNAVLDAADDKKDPDANPPDGEF